MWIVCETWDDRDMSPCWRQDKNGEPIVGQPRRFQSWKAATDWAYKYGPQNPIVMEESECPAVWFDAQ